MKNRFIRKDLTGQKFERLTAIKPCENVNNETAWLCQCICGNTKKVKTSHLLQNHTKSCGCLNNEKRAARAKKMYSVRIKHSPREASAHKIWKNRYSDGNLSFQDFLTLTQHDCFYCGAYPNNCTNCHKSDRKTSQFAKDNGDFIYNGLDRINSDLPHNLENVVPACKFCNWAKTDRTLDEFKLWIEKIYFRVIKL